MEESGHGVADDNVFPDGAFVGPPLLGAACELGELGSRFY